MSRSKLLISLDSYNSDEERELEEAIKLSLETAKRPAESSIVSSTSKKPRTLSDYENLIEGAQRGISNALFNKLLFGMHDLTVEELLKHKITLMHSEEPKPSESNTEQAINKNKLNKNLLEGCFEIIASAKRNGQEPNDPAYLNYDFLSLIFNTLPNNIERLAIFLCHVSHPNNRNIFMEQYESKAQLLKICAANVENGEAYLELVLSVIENLAGKSKDSKKAIDYLYNLFLEDDEDDIDDYHKFEEKFFEDQEQASNIINNYIASLLSDRKAALQFLSSKIERTENPDVTGLDLVILFDQNFIEIGILERFLILLSPEDFTNLNLNHKDTKKNKYDQGSFLSAQLSHEKIMNDDPSDPDQSNIKTPLTLIMRVVGNNMKAVC